jgi:hypothetical protein
MEFPLRLPAVMLLLLPAARPGRLPAGSRLTTLRRRVRPGILLRGPLPISAGQLDLELIELIPLGIGPLPLRNRLKRPQAVAGGNRLLFIFIHDAIISLLPVTTDN